MLPIPSLILADDNWSGENEYGIPVKNITDMLKSGQLDKLIIVVMTYQPAPYLANLDWIFVPFEESEKIYTVLLEMQIHAYFFYKINSGRINKLYNKLADEESKYVFKKYLQYCLEGAVLFSMIQTDNSYWYNDIVPEIKNGDVIVQAGVCDGSDIDGLLTKGLDIEIHGIEPDLKLVDRLNEKYEGFPNVHIYPYGAGKKSEILKFSYGTDSMLANDCMNVVKDGSGTIEIQIEPLDNLIKGPVNLIAMDIEGSELDALKGAKNIITEYRPIIAARAYHKLSHWLALAEYLETLCPEYMFYFRHHGSFMVEFTLYAKVEN